MICLIVVCYKRIDGIRRLYKSLCKAHYGTDVVELVFSVDFSDIQSEIVSELETYNWIFGNKTIRTFDTRQGLRNHIISCGDLSQNYDALVVLEDDLIVAPGFYDYVKQAVEFYKDYDSIKGISLYTHLINPGCSRPFIPSQNKFDAFFMQYAQSWGQCWTPKMWSGFKEWYANHNDSLTTDGLIPDYVSHWNNNSWLKYYIKYTVVSNGFFVYPYCSLTSNNTDVGEHNIRTNNDYQVPMLEGTKVYDFPSESEAIKYDAFFERILPDDVVLPEISGRKMLDLYGLRTNYEGTDILVSTNILNYEVLRSIKLKYRPHEINCIDCEDGHDIFVYNLSRITKNKSRLKSNRYDLIRYDVKAINWRRTLLHSVNGLLNGIYSRFFRK